MLLHYSISIYFTAFSGKQRLLCVSLFRTHTSSRLPLSGEPLKNTGCAALHYVYVPAQGAVYCGNYNLWVIALQESLGLEHTQRKGRRGGVFRRECTIGGDTALRLCVQVERVTLPREPHACVFLFPWSSYKTALIDWRKLMNRWNHVLPHSVSQWCRFQFYKTKWC